MRPERRIRRSNDDHTAIKYQLQVVAEELGARTMFVADSDGLVLGEAGHPNEAKVVGAVAPLLLKSTSDPKTQMVLRSQLDPLGDKVIFVKSFEFKGQQLAIGAVTSSPIGPEGLPSIERAVTGVCRILDQARYARKRPGSPNLPF